MRVVAGTGAPAAGGDLGHARLLDIARDHPEAVGILLECGLPVREWGRVVLSSIPESAAVADRISGVTDWRRGLG